jgi:hypothetical protein
MITALPRFSRNSLPSEIRRSPLKFRLSALLILLAFMVSAAAHATVYTVTDNTDNAADTGSLRYAVNTATSGSDTILFSGVIGTITLTNGTLAIANGVTIEGPGANLLTISGNHAVTVFTISSGTVTISGLTIANGNTGGNGGGIYSAGTLTVENSTFSGNVASSGGGIFNDSTLIVENSTFSGNIGADGGGIFNFTGDTLTVSNSTFFGNQSGGGGGIISQGTAIVSNSTFFSNTAGTSQGVDEGGGILNNFGTITVTNSIVAGNTHGDCQNCGGQSANNLIGATPDLGPLQYNGGSTQTMMPLPGSPAIGTGSSSTLSIDQRGFARSIGAISDLGAVSTNYLTVTTTADSTETTTCTGGATCSLLDAIADANNAGSGDIVFANGASGPIYVSPNPTPNITGNMNIAGGNLVTISGANSGNVFTIQSGTPTVNISGMTIINGGDSNNGYSGFRGGAIVNYNGTLTVSNVVFSGGASGIVNDSISNSVPALIVTDCSFYSNNARPGLSTSGSGAGMDIGGGTVIVNNSSFFNNIANRGAGISVTGGQVMVNDSTVFDNTASTLSGNPGAGGGIAVSSPGVVTLTNSIVAGNTTNGVLGDDCDGCGTQSAYNLIGGNPNLGQQYSVSAGQFLLPLPGSAAIQAGNPALLPAGIVTDERGFPRLTNGELDLGATQTNYTSVQFVQQPVGVAVSQALTPAVSAEVLETNTNTSATDAVEDIPLTLTLNGTGTLGGTLTQTTAGGIATFGDLSVNAAGTADTLAISLPVTPSGAATPLMLTASSNSFDISQASSTVSFSPSLPVSVTFGQTAISLGAIASASGTPTGQTMTFQVDSGPATITAGNQLNFTGAGTVLVEADAAANASYGASDIVASIAVGQAATTLTLTASTNQTTPGAAVVLTATAASTAGTPTGTVTFLTASGPVGTANLNGLGVATVSVTTLPVGSTVIEASYSGDTNFIGSGAQLSAPVVIGTPTFNMTSSVSNLTIQPGQTGTATLTLTPGFGYAGTVNFVCNGLPLHSTCTFTPSSVTFTGSGSAVTATLTIATSVHGQMRNSNLVQLKPLHPLRELPILPAMFFWLPESLFILEDSKEQKGRKKSNKALLAVLLLILGAGMLSLVGCGGGTSFNTPAGQQSVTITATGSGGVSQSISLQVNIS